MQSQLDEHGIGTSNFLIKGAMMRYSVFVPKLYNFCKSVGFTAGKMLPSRAFCSDESQGFPIILITKHFGCFPFNHGMVGGIVATDRHGPHADHGKDLLIIQASHVGYDADDKRFGVYRRLQTDSNSLSSNCGKIDSVLEWYLSEYRFARENIFIRQERGQFFVTIDNQFLDESRKEGLFLRVDRLTSATHLVEVLSTSKQFVASAELVAQLSNEEANSENNVAILNHLTASFFYYKREIEGGIEGHGHLENNLLDVMPVIVTSNAPLLTAAMFNTRAEFDRSYRSIIKNRRYLGKKVLLISGINIDISPQPGQVFPLTKFVPWAAYIQSDDGSGVTYEQKELLEVLSQQSAENADQIDLENAISEMVEANEVLVEAG
ncbi:MAG: hypothetical protein OEY11_13730 [Gammaproteobacteria bacterium]|nr:hypothetical protein [Gammaproteobacteria bacterium]